jgi:hypothetical protein
MSTSQWKMHVSINSPRLINCLRVFCSSLSLKKLSLNSYWPSAYGSLFEVTWYCITIIIIIYIKKYPKAYGKKHYDNEDCNSIL